MNLLNQRYLAGQSQSGEQACTAKFQPGKFEMAEGGRCFWTKLVICRQAKPGCYVFCKMGICVDCGNGTVRANVRIIAAIIAICII